MSDKSDVLYKVHDNVAEITINRPRYRNAQSRVLLERLDKCFQRASKDRDVRVIALFGAGEHFSSGHDLGTADEIRDRENRPPQEGVRGRFDHSYDNYVEKTLRWRNLPKPTIVGVQGYCIFGGWIIASAMDIIYAGESALFLGSNFQYFSIPWDVSVRRAKELLFEGRFINAEEACELGLVNKVLPDTDLRKGVLDYASRVVENDPFQLRMTKMAVNHVQDSQGFQAHIEASHVMHILSATGEQDPEFSLKTPERKRRPMVERAIENSKKGKSE
ncbi:MAG: enoyl-CoA hydratase [Gammaproteobacteria bacterium]|nr:enoyl-CoA hydratase [Gammaproteobacteria bacterium]MYD80509.1 enoyl-CoA hydratase [Gammaproteobacteria bacterium]